MSTTPLSVTLIFVTGDNVPLLHVYPLGSPRFMIELGKRYFVNFGNRSEIDGLMIMVLYESVYGGVRTIDGVMLIFKMIAKSMLEGVS